MAHLRAFLFIAIVPLLFTAVPAHAAAGDIAAGFVPSTLWLSQSTPTAGSSVKISTVVYNSSQTALEGSVTFSADNAIIGSTPFSLGAGESAIESVTWTTTEGQHTLKASIESVIDRKTKSAAAIAQTVTAPITVVVLPEAPKAPALEAIDTAQSAVASSTPVMATIIAKTTDTTESIRKAGESYLATLAGEPATANATTTAAKPKSSVLGASTEVTEASTSPASDSIGSKIAKVLLPLFRYPALFYPVFLFFILFAFWLVAKKLRNPKRR